MFIITFLFCFFSPEKSVILRILAKRARKKSKGASKEFFHPWSTTNMLNEMNRMKKKIVACKRSDDFYFYCLDFSCFLRPSSFVLFLSSLSPPIKRFSTLFINHLISIKRKQIKVCFIEFSVRRKDSKEEEKGGWRIKGLFCWCFSVYFCWVDV